jgi:hypothetical protein
MPCPGYDRSFKFIVGKPYRQRRRRPDSESDDTQTESSTSDTPFEMQAAGQMLIERTSSDVRQSRKIARDYLSGGKPCRVATKE